MLGQKKSIPQQSKKVYLPTYHRQRSGRVDSSDLLFWSSQTDNKPGGHVSACNNMVQQQDQRQRETLRMGYESNGQCIVSENDLLVNIKGDTVSLRCK